MTGILNVRPYGPALLGALWLAVGAAAGVGCGSVTATPNEPDGAADHPGGGGASGTGGTVGSGGQVGTGGTVGSGGQVGSGGAGGAPGSGGHPGSGGSGSGGTPVDAPPDTPPDIPNDRTCICQALPAPVCGTDGKTYNNKCEADCAGVAVAHMGVCCTTDGDCLLYPGAGSGCCGVCQLKTDPRPSMPACLLACRNPITTCACVKGECTGGRGGTMQ